jgi:pimeloyl-ACP methyl ester carboxylesterase
MDVHFAAWSTRVAHPPRKYHSAAPVVSFGYAGDMSTEVLALRTRDAIVVVPGIMGSELIEAATGKVLWGFSDVNWYLSAWTTGSSLNALRLTEKEQDGRYGRVRATCTLRFPAYAPMLQGFEPYTRLLDRVRRVSVHPDAVAEFPYDWRLPVVHNARLLAEFVDRHITAWRRHPALLSPSRDSLADDEPQVVIVAHSMGGLVARQMALIPGATQHLRSTVTLGTPFYGSVKAVQLLGRGGPGPRGLPRGRLRELAAGLPGVHDLLPRYRCVDTGSDARQLSVGDVVAIGGSKDLATTAEDDYRRAAEADLVGHVQLVGTHQPTVQSVTIVDGAVTAQRYSCRPTPDGIRHVDLYGDGTVARQAAQLPTVPVIPLAQMHGALARADEAILVVTDVLTHHMTGPWLGGGQLGLDVPDVVLVRQEFRVTMTGIEHPRDVWGNVVSLRSGRQVVALLPALEDGGIRAKVRISEPGLFRVEVSGGGSRVTQIVLVAETGFSEAKASDRF